MDFHSPLSLPIPTLSISYFNSLFLPSCLPFSSPLSLSPLPGQKMDYTNMSLTQAKRLEMESQVKALELEKELETERTRLAELRKIHYHLAGASEGWEEVRRGEGSRKRWGREMGFISFSLSRRYGRIESTTDWNTNYHFF